MTKNKCCEKCHLYNHHSGNFCGLNNNCPCHQEDKCGKWDCKKNHDKDGIHWEERKSKEAVEKEWNRIVKTITKPKETIEDWRVEFYKRTSVKAEHSFLDYGDDDCPPEVDWERVKSFIHTQKQLSYKEGQFQEKCRDKNLEYNSKNPYRCDKCFIGDLHKARQFNCIDSKCGCPCEKFKIKNKNTRTSLIQELIEECEGMKVDFEWENDECTKCGFLSIVYDESHECTSKNQALSQVLTLLKSKLSEK